MKINNSNFYRDIEYRYLELFRDCALSKEFLPIFQKFNKTILFRRNMYRVEEPTKREKNKAVIQENQSTIKKNLITLLSVIY